MKKFCVVTNSFKDDKLEIAKKISNYLSDKKCDCVLIDNVDCATGKYRVLKSKDIPKDTECIVSIGGDGTLLHAAKDFIDLDVVFVGVNKGTLGFLAEISPDNLYIALDKLINDNFNVESRMMLEGKVIREGEEIYSTTVLNDIVIHRGGDLAITDYQVYVNKEILGNYHADGIILATPTGSTAYNLSAGGPIARPDSNMIILTPICPHTLANRSLILSRHDKIDVKIGKSKSSNENNRKASFDGDDIFNIISDDIISISKSEKTTKIAKIDKESFLQAVKNKLN